MKIQGYHPFALAALSCAGILLSENVIATSSSDSSTTTFSDDSFSSGGCVTEYIADGDCDLYNNNEDCGGYDGGDCCECTCVSSTSYECGAGYHGGYSCIDPSAECVDDDDVTTNPEEEDYPSSYTTTDSTFTTYSSPYSTTSLGCIAGYISDGYCDQINNNEECGFDGGDCCECTCVDTDSYTCGEDSTYPRGFACLDPSAPCADDDDFDPENYEYTYSDDDYMPDSSSYSQCLDEVSGNGNCDWDNNIHECGYDGGDCCECDCESTEEYTCGGNSSYNCTDPSSSCINGFVLAGTKTTISVSANAFDTRAGEASGDVGCGDDGCAPELSRDGDSEDVESRWSCKQDIVPDGEPCEIEFVFDDPQDIMEVQVAFWKGDERARTVEAAINGEVIGDFHSYHGSTFNALGIQGVGVDTLTLKYVDVADNGWISLMEVRFLVEP